MTIKITPKGATPEPENHEFTTCQACQGRGVVPLVPDESPQERFVQPVRERDERRREIERAYIRSQFQARGLVYKPDPDPQEYDQVEVTILPPEDDE